MENQNISDLINLIGLIIGVMNFEENLTQGDKQDLLDEFNNKTKIVLNSIDSHLKEQDRKIDEILKILKEKQ